MGMNRLRKNSTIDDSLLVAYTLLTIIGLVMVYSTSSMIAESRFGSHMFFFKNQVKWAVLSAIAIVLIIKTDLKRYSVYSAPALLAVLFMLSLVFLMPSRNGSQRWLMLGFITIQPSELFKFIMIFFLAFSLSNPKRNITELKQLLFPYSTDYWDRSVLDTIGTGSGNYNCNLFDGTNNFFLSRCQNENICFMDLFR